MVGVVKHGTRATYNDHKCRCSACTEANRLYIAGWRMALASHEPPVDAHGKSSTYTNWACRCAECTAAHSLVRRGQGRSRKVLS